MRQRGASPQQGADTVHGRAGPPQPDQDAQSPVPAVLRHGGNAGRADDGADDARPRHVSATADDDAASDDRGNDDDGRDD